MTKNRVKFSTILNNQIPSYVREEFPLVSEFLKQYYISQEFQGSPADLIQNIDQYIKLNSIYESSDSVTLGSDISFSDDTILVSDASGTIGFPERYGLIKIDDEIILYTSKTQTSFIGCIRGFSGISSYGTENSDNKLVFESTESADHYEYIDNDTSKDRTKIINLSSLFLNEFLKKIKYQIVPGFERREFYENLNENLFLKQSKDFYSTKGTDNSFRILFNSLYGEDVEVIKPQNYLIKPSDASYRVANNLVVESISGDPYELVNSTLFQDEYGDIVSGFAPIASVEKIYSDDEKNYYKLSFDSGYNKDINVSGSLYGTFSVHPKTRLIGEASVGQTTLDVDSTIGFPNSGEIAVTYNDGQTGVISYTSKNLNQFFGCSNVEKPILDAVDVTLNTFAYGVSSKENSDELIKVKITSVLKDVKINGDAYYQSKGDSGIIRTLGLKLKPSDPISNKWITNIATSFEVRSLELVDSISKVYKVLLYDDHNLRVGDTVNITSNDSVKNTLTVISVISSKEFDIGRNVTLFTEKTYTIDKSLSKVNHVLYEGLSNEIANVQNVYVDNDKVLISTPSLPFYNNQPLVCSDRSIIFSGTFFGDTFKITNTTDHNFYTGDAIYYSPSNIGEKLSEEGLFFVKRVDEFNIKLAKSRSDIFNSKFINITTQIQVVSDKIEPYEFKNRSLKSQKLLREIKPPINNGQSYQTNPGPIGILNNGTEILNYKSKDKVYYGQIEKIDVVSSGIGYDVTNPPILDVIDFVGSGATGYCSVSGGLVQIRILDSGFDYIETPQININGGNGLYAKAYPVMKLVDNEVSFVADQKSSQVNLSNNTIGFSTYHKFRSVEKVIYQTDNLLAVGGISTNSVYYASSQDLKTITLHPTFDDAAVGINTISLTSFGSGKHSFRSYNKKSVISSINIVNSGSGYENKKRSTNTVGINTSIDQITIGDHGFNSGEIVRYTTNGTKIAGLDIDSDYYLTKVDSNNFKLSLVGFGTDNKDFYYKNKEYVKLASVGSGVHYFNYQPITVEVIGNTGVSSATGDLFKAKIQSIFRGEITSVHLESKGNGYGSADILNYNKEPLVTLRSGEGSELFPIINNGKIIEVLVNNAGRNYDVFSNISVVGDGIGAVLVPIVEDGQIKSIKVIEGGINYNQNTTSVFVTSPGSGAQFEVKLQTWTVNLVQKYFNSITPDDGFIFYNSYTKGDLQYSHLYAPRKLRETEYSVSSDGEILYGNFDLVRQNGNEVSSTKHSPIIGWAYDGNPIYGPYAYSTKTGKDGASIVQLKSGYRLLTSQDQNRPSTTLYPRGFFVEDYVYDTSLDDITLDEFNGRFCVTPEFPQGTYAYFATFNTSRVTTAQSPFRSYKEPQFPYLIGNSFKSVPNQFNLLTSSNQDDIDLGKTDWIRNTTFYNFLNEKSSYKYINIPNKLNQKVSIKYSSPGSVESIGIVTGGNGYKIGDYLVSDDENTGGFGFSAVVSALKGKEINSISVATTEFYSAEIYPETNRRGFFSITLETPHNLKDQDVIVISGVNTTSSKINNNFYVANVSNLNTLSLTKSVDSVSNTGIVTYISISGDIDKIRENDIFSISEEKVKVLNIDKNSSRLRVLRSYDGTVGSAHSYSEVLYENPRKFLINAGVNTSFKYKQNKEIYFDPKESVGLGTTGTGVGIGTTISISNPGAGAIQVFVPIRSIYLPDHDLETGDELIYSPNGGSPIGVSTNGGRVFNLPDQQKVYVSKISKDFIGISTVKVGLGSTGTFVGIASTTRSLGPFYFSSNGTESYHSFKTIYKNLTGNISKNVVTVGTAESHGLVDNDYVFVNVNSSISTSFTVKYDDYNGKLILNPKSFVASGISTTENTISIYNHGFKTGQKIIHSSSSNVLENNTEYYVIVVDSNTIKLSSSYSDSIKSLPTIVGISSAYSGTLMPVNPPIDLFKNSTVTFDVSDPSLGYTRSNTSYSAFNFNLYTDPNFTNSLESLKLFNITRIGTVGISSNAKVILNIDEDIPSTLFYKLDPIYSDILPTVKEKISIDSSISLYNQINIKNSLYNGKYPVVSISSTEFVYNLPIKPETNYYDQFNSKIYYTTNSKNVEGPVEDFNVTFYGKNYYTLPSFVRLESKNGSGALLNYSSKSIGKIEKVKMDDIGFNFPTDFTLKPDLFLPQILKIDPLSSFDSIKITSIGDGYTHSPKLIVLDGLTKRIIPEIDLSYELQDTSVRILKNTYGISNITPIIIPIHNSNGVGISSIVYDQVTNNVTVTLSVGFSTADTFPFEVDDRVLIENISVGINSDGKGFNSKNYNYELFTLTGVSENLGGIGIVTYSMKNLLSDGEFPGTYNDINSFGKIIAEKYFPQFEVELKTNNYNVGESVRYLDSSETLGVVEGWDEKTSYVRILSKEVIEKNRVLQGENSKTQGIISSTVKPNATINFDAYSKFENGWERETGFLNNNFQRVQDSFYYQNFSYSLKSRVPYDKWEDVIGSLNHTLGFKKFSDYQCEPSFAEVQDNKLSVGVSTSRLDSSIGLVGIANLNCYYDFDLVRENALRDEDSIFSSEVYFNSRILTDYFESVGNRVLSIDDFSGSFYNLPRTTRYSVAHRFALSDFRAQKYITYVKDRRYFKQRQLMLVTLVHDNVTGYLNQYGRVESSSDLGSFDFSIENNEGLLLFYPQKYLWNDYDVTTFVYNLKDTFIGIASTNFGGVSYFDANTVQVSSGSTTIIGVGVTFTSVKAIVEISTNNGRYEFNELNVIHDGTDVNMINYAPLSSGNSSAYSSSEIGSFDAYISGSQLKIDFTPNVGISATISSVSVSIADTTSTGIGTHDLQYTKIESRSTSIGASASPIANVIGEYPDTYNGAYYIVQISDTTNNMHQLSEVIVVDDEDTSYETEFATLYTKSGIGTIGSLKTPTSTQLVFTPNPNINVEVKVYSNSIRDFRDDTKELSFNNDLLVNQYEVYYGSAIDIKRAFDLNYRQKPIFKRGFNASSSDIVDLNNNTIKLEDHFFVTGEKLIYSSGTISESNSPIGIQTTDFGVGIGTTEKIPSTVYAIKVDKNKIKLAKSAEDALSFVPKTLDFVSLGIGTNHTFTSINQNARALITLDNVIQSPVASTATTSHLTSPSLISEDILYFNNTTEFFTDSLIKIDDEIMRIDSVGVGSTNAVRVNRPWLGSTAQDHSLNSKVIKLQGDYNIVENRIHFVTAPYGKVPIGTTTNAPDEIDWQGISTNSTFYGRVFMRSSEINSDRTPYSKNYVFDDISDKFNGRDKEFIIKSDYSDVSDMSDDNAIILLNEVFQQPGVSGAYNLVEGNVGITSIVFVGAATSTPADINTSNLPSGGIIVSVGSTSGYGYQPLVSAGGTAIVSASGTISAISIGNSGSGYRKKIQNYFITKDVTVRVGVATSSTETAEIQFIGTASVTNGNVVSIAITNPGIGYTRSNPPYVIIDPPLSYSDIPLIYRSSSGIGTRATIDIVVGQGSSVIDFEIKNIGYAYKPGDILTVDTNSISGIPTVQNSTFNPFEISIQRTSTDKFSGWSIGQLQILDNIERFFTGDRVIFPLRSQGQLISILSAKGSDIVIRDNLLIFINEILQIPGKSYIFDGGSTIRFTEPPKVGDTCSILFYKGSGDIDVPLRNTLETVKPGDEIMLTYDSSLGQEPSLLENPRTVTEIKSIDFVETNPYFGPGNTPDQVLSRPLVWCKQTSDKIINQKEVGKDRMLYEALIYPSTHIIKSVGIGSTVIFVDNVRPFFNPLNENISSLQFQKNVRLYSQDNLVSAAATALVSSSSTISSIVITNGGFGYNEPPQVAIQNPIGIGTTTTTAISSITSGSVTSIEIVGVVTGYSQSNPPLVIIEPPKQKFEDNTSLSYSGDFGIITGIATTSVGVASTGIIFDFVIPSNSPLRNSSITGLTTISSIANGYYFTVSNSNVGNGVTSLDYGGNIVGVGTSFLDGVYHVADVSIARTSSIGFGVTYVARVTVSVSSYNQLSGIGISNYYGDFSWGRILLGPRQKENAYDAYTTEGYPGISTGTIVRRSSPLKYSDYLI
jgi:hypothetical protein